MATEDVKKFLDRVNREPEVQKKLQEAQARFVEIGKEHGYDFTKEELHGELRQRWGITKAKDDPDTTCAA